MSGIAKRYGDCVALESASLNVEKGTIHAVVGENGAGKTTLMKALYGSMIPDAGTIEVQGQRVTFSNSKDALSKGIGMVSQHYGIIGELSCLENLVLGAEDSPVLDRKSMTVRANELSDWMGFKFEWNAPASTLSPAGAQKLEILKLLWRNAEIMILDEPTAMLSPADAGQLFDSLRKLTAEGATVIIVTHRLSEVFDYSKNVTVLRGGKFIVERPVEGVGSTELAELIVGGALIQHPPMRSGNREVVALSVNDLTVTNHTGLKPLSNCSFQVLAGELVGIAGVDGNGQRELFHALIGLEANATGQIRCNGKDWTAEDTEARLKSGLRVIPEDRLEEGVIEDWSLVENATLGLQRIAGISSTLASGTDAEASRIAAEFNTKFSSLTDSMASLSGGNQQRFVAARALMYDPKLVLAFQPARGLDLNSTARVYTKMREVCDAGACGLVVSFDLDELLEYCDRILVLNEGKLSAPAKGFEKDRETIGRLMVGASP